MRRFSVAQGLNELSYTDQSHSCRADKNPYRHDGRADKDTYRHDGLAYSLSLNKMSTQYSGMDLNGRPVARGD